MLKLLCVMLTPVLAASYFALVVVGGLMYAFYSLLVAPVIVRYL